MRVVVAGYIVRNPLGGYAWQHAHYLAGLRALGHDAWFYEDTGHYALAYDPEANTFEATYDYGIKAAGQFLERLGFGDRWVFVDVARGQEYGPGAGRARELLREADLLVNIAGVNRIIADQRGGRPSAYVDIDPGVTQIRADAGDRLLGEILDEHRWHFTYGELIGTPACRVPTAGYTWRATRPPVHLPWWATDGAGGATYTTVGRWDENTRDLEWRGETFRWRKRSEWMRCLDLPGRTGADFEVAMDVTAVPGDREVLRSHGWRTLDPRAISADPFRYRAYIQASRGEFTVAKELNVRLRTGWFSDRGACYLAAGRPAVEHDTGFGDVLSVGPGLHAFRTVEEATQAIQAVEADYPAAARHAAEVAQTRFGAEAVVGRMLEQML